MFFSEKKLSAIICLLLLTLSVSAMASILIINGTETFSCSNTYYGTITINDGATILHLADAGSIENSGVINNGNFSISIGANSSIVSLSGSGNVILNNNMLLKLNTFSGSGNASGAGEVITGCNNEALNSAECLL